MLNTAYDTAWVACVPDRHRPTQPAFPEALEWLRTSQHPDGSWGSEIKYYHDRIISTAGALVAFAKWGNPQRDGHIIHKGKEYLRQHIHMLTQDPYETVGFELIFPVLIEMTRSLGIDMSAQPSYQQYQRLRTEKLRLIPTIFSRKTTAVHSLEFLGDALQADQAPQLQEANGSFGNSPSATAYFLCQRADERASRYLADVVMGSAGAAGPLHPVEIFNKAWVLYYLDLSGGLAEWSADVRAHYDFFYQHWDPKWGVGFSRQYSVPDLDDTAVVFKLLYQAGYAVKPDVFCTYERETHFMCFPHERNPSVGVHVHLLDALRVCPEFSAQPRMIKKILTFLHQTRQQQAYWFDKWHASPYYITAHAVTALIGHDNAMARAAVRWILDTRLPGGAWGVYGPNAEETAYCLQALITYHRQVEPLDRQWLLPGLTYLRAEYGRASYPALWIDKCLYTPMHIVQAAILSALRLGASLQHNI